MGLIEKFDSFLWFTMYANNFYSVIKRVNLCFHRQYYVNTDDTVAQQASHS
jgi:hypothetical protein